MTENPEITRTNHRETIHDRPNAAKRGFLDPFEEQDKVNVRLITYPAGSLTDYHNHNDIEYWTVVSGRLRIWMDDHQFELSQGESVRVEPLQIHRIEALEEDSIMQAVWWADSAFFNKAVSRSLDRDLDERTPLIVQPPMVTPNGNMHLGHASGPFLLADMAARALRSQGREVYLVQGTQGHLQYLEISAAKQGGGYYETANGFSESIRESLRRLQIDYDFFLGMNAPSSFEEICHNVMKRMQEAGLVAEIEHEVFYDVDNESYLTEALVKGTCPHCHSPGATSECEGCGATIVDADLIDATDYKGQEHAKRPIRRLFLKTECLRDAIKQYAASTLLPTQARLYIENWLARPLPDVCLTNPFDHGIAVENSDLEKQKYTDVLERIARYFYCLEDFGKRLYGCRGFEELNPTQMPVTLSLFGSDNAFGRLVIFPALMIVLGYKSAAPRMVLMNEFLLLDGEKFSTSRNHAIWVNDYVDSSNVDPFRFYVALKNPVGRQTNFSSAEFEAWHCDHWQPRISDTLDKATAFLHSQTSENQVPMPGIWARDDVTFYAALSTLKGAMETYYDLQVLDFAGVARHIELFADHLARYLSMVSTRSDLKFVQNSSQIRTEARMVAAATITLALALEPLCPRTARATLSRFVEPWHINNWGAIDILTAEIVMRSN